MIRKICGQAGWRAASQLRTEVVRGTRYASSRQRELAKAATIGWQLGRPPINSVARSVWQPRQPHSALLAQASQRATLDSAMTSRQSAGSAHAPTPLPSSAPRDDLLSACSSDTVPAGGLNRCPTVASARLEPSPVSAHGKTRVLAATPEQVQNRSE